MAAARGGPASASGRGPVSSGSAKDSFLGFALTLRQVAVKSKFVCKLLMAMLIAGDTMHTLVTGQHT